MKKLFAISILIVLVVLLLIVIYLISSIFFYTILTCFAIALLIGWSVSVVNNEI